MSTTFVILNVAFAALVVGVITGMMLWAIKTSPRDARMLRIARERRLPAQARSRTRVTTRPAYDV
jgi:hypothetical protein